MADRIYTREYIFLFNLKYFKICWQLLFTNISIIINISHSSAPDKMLSKNNIQLLISLQKKKERDDRKLYVIEGDKLIREFLNAGIRLKSLFALREFLESITADNKNMIEEINSVSQEDLKRISSFKTPNSALAVVQMNDSEDVFTPEKNELYLALDSVQDPGNLGTILRSAAWFGIKDIICSPECADRYNPKVIQASMGAILHTKVVYRSLPGFLQSAIKAGLPVYGTMLEGKSIYSADLSKNGVILLGNESKGISQELIPFISEKIMIPKKTTHSYGIDSLNVSMAAAIICSEFARRFSGR